MMLLAYAVSALLLLWILFLAVMTLQAAKHAGTLKGLSLVLGLVVLAFGLAVDAAVNILVLSVVLVELPREWLVTKRLKRHEAAPSGWRRAVAHAICRRLLNPFDPRGYHCAPP